MRIVRVLDANRKLMAAGVIAMFAFAAGCGGSDPGESKVAPETPPPGQSGKDIGSAVAKDIAAHSKGAMGKK